MTLIVNSEEAGDLIRSDSRGRLLVPPEQREALLDAFEHSGLSGVTFCRQHGLKYPTFATWVQKRRGRGQVSGESSLKARPVSFVEVMTEAVAGSGEPSGTLAITLADGTRIDVSSRSQLPWVADLLRQLKTSCSC